MFQNPESKNEIVILIPVYREELTHNEQLCLKRNVEILKAYPIVILAPKGLNMKNLEKFGLSNTEYFEDKYFDGLSGYNRFMLSIEFYNRFREYKYLLICQLDVFVFSDQLKYWCQKNYDYIGAPWINKPVKILSYVLIKVGMKSVIQLLLTQNIFKAIGNGGFSLRRTDTFLTVLSENKEIAENWKANEDYFWSFFASVEGKALKKPGSDEASLFCIEQDAAILFKKNNGRLPFAIHAWNRYNANFWEPFLRELGYKFE